MFEEIANADLREEHIPAPDANWGIISEFSLSFDGYAYWGSSDKCAEIGNNSKQDYADRGTLPVSFGVSCGPVYFSSNGAFITSASLRKDRT